MHYSGFMDAKPPQALQRLLEFVNTSDIEERTDEIATPATLRSWLGERGLMPAGTEVDDDDVAAARQLRETLRLALLANGGATAATADAGDAGDATGVTAPATSVPLQMTIAPDGTATLEPTGTGVTAALGTLVSVIPGAIADGSWARAKVCPKDSCRWAFYDQSRNRSRRWCAMDVCGNREKTRAFRERQQEAEQD